MRQLRLSLYAERLRQGEHKDFFSRGTNVLCIACKKTGAIARQGAHKRPREHDKTCAACNAAKSPADFRKGRDECKKCERIMCTHCGLLPQSSFSTKCVEHYMYNNRNVCCRACRTKGLDPRSGAYKRTGTNGIICAECGMEKASTNFRRSKNSLVQVCRDCEKIECDGCRRDILASKFDTKDRHSYFERGHRVICCDCKTRLQRLRTEFQKSARRKCTCGRPMGHKENCPMHPRRAGETPYPACDVLTRDESEWLHARGKL